MTLPADFVRAITPESINALDIRRYEGEVVLVASEADRARAMEDFAGERVAGFDTETRPSFRPGESHPPALAQLATARAVYLFQLQRAEHGGALAPILASKTIKAGVGVADDLRQLRRAFHFEPRNFVDLSLVARRHGLEKTGVRTLAALFLGCRIPKGTKTSNWAHPRLTRQQITYAATDAWVCRELYLKFEELRML